MSQSTDNNIGVLVPPRRREQCVRNITTKLNSIENKDGFKTELLQSPFIEGKLLCELYKKHKNITLHAMKYSFTDCGYIIKGTDIMDNYFLNLLKPQLVKLIKEIYSHDISKNCNNGWENNKKTVWNAMLCGYKASDANFEESDCSICDDKTD
ncbi:erythrocyte membrane protein 1, PfEMP1, putative [Plasmodium sp.]|nr:erythrocyte membrane protein 1, PfEMP1, putative [Plasmodium sp.]